MSTESIGSTISELRKAKGATQEDLAKHAGVSAQAVSKWECGGTPDIELLPSIADFLEVSIDKLFDRNINDYSDIKTEIVKYLTPLKEKDRVRDMLELVSAKSKQLEEETRLLLNDNRFLLANLANALLEKGTLHGEEIDKVLEICE